MRVQHYDVNRSFLMFFINAAADRASKISPKKVIVLDHLGRTHLQHTDSVATFLFCF